MKEQTMIDEMDIDTKEVTKETSWKLEWHGLIYILAGMGIWDILEFIWRLFKYFTR